MARPVTVAAPMRRSSPHSIRCLRATALLLFVIPAFAHAVHAEDPKKLQYSGYVNDFAGVLSDDAKARLTALCAEVDHQANAQIAVVTVHSLEGEPTEQFSIDLATHWGVGPKQKDRGVLILLAPNDHKYRVEVGYGLEGILPDGKVGGFGREMVPLLRQNDYGSALLLLTGRIAAVIAQDRGVTLTASPPPPRAEHERGPNIASWIPFIIFLFFFIGFPLLGLIFRLIFGLGPSSRGRRGGWGFGGPWILGGGSGGWSGGGGGGFGGFGGGGFGGGGASGSW